MFNLRCDQSHRFEGWFDSADAFTEQQSRGFVTCPMCDSLAIERLPSAPHIGLNHGRELTPSPAAAKAITPDWQDMVRAGLRQLARSAEDVGDRLATEARAIQAGDAPMRSIKGQASADEVRELREDGLAVLPILDDDKALH